MKRAGAVETMTRITKQFQYEMDCIFIERCDAVSLSNDSTKETNDEQ